MHEGAARRSRGSCPRAGPAPRLTFPGRHTIPEHHQPRDLTDALLDQLLSSGDAESFLHALAARLSSHLLGPHTENPAIVTLLCPRRPPLTASTGAAARALAETGSASADGPVTAALAEHAIVRVGDTRTDHRWPRRLAAAAAEGIRSVLALPFALEDDAQAALTLLSPEPHDFGPAMIERAEQPIRQASKVLRLAVRLDRCRALEHDLRTALSTRTTIDLAVGILMAQRRTSQDEAVALLKRASQYRNVLLRDLATEVVESFSRRPPRTHFES